MIEVGSGKAPSAAILVQLLELWGPFCITFHLPSLSFTTSITFCGEQSLAVDCIFEPRFKNQIFDRLAPPNPLLDTYLLYLDIQWLPQQSFGFNAL